MSELNTFKPEWTPAEAGAAFAGRVMRGISHPHSHSTRPAPSRSVPNADELSEGILAGNRTLLARAITLVESNAAAHREVAAEVVKRLLPYSGKSIRVGITGVPGAGKSTFIEALGMLLCEAGQRLAVLAVDPSSSVTHGSILGDKTRMERLSRHPDAFIRPSPTGGNLGGVTRKSRETIVLCEAAGFDVILVETVGVGQSETTVRSMVDFFLLLMIAGGGDDLQGIKKGVMELADAVIINKADGENAVRAECARQEMETILRLLAPATSGWKPQALACSSLSGKGVEEIWKLIIKFQSSQEDSGEFLKNRQRQRQDWMHAMIRDQLNQAFYAHPEVQRHVTSFEQQVVRGKLSASAAAEDLLRFFIESGKK
ncbi:MAG: methylmalonyl Co-A mutase-associated GTPase MeaB [Candidatus Methylacidiphilales bacterium]